MSKVGSGKSGSLLRVSNGRLEDKRDSRDFPSSLNVSETIRSSNTSVPVSPSLLSSKINDQLQFSEYSRKTAELLSSIAKYTALAKEMAVFEESLLQMLKEYVGNSTSPLDGTLKRLTDLLPGHEAQFKQAVSCEKELQKIALQSDHLFALLEKPLNEKHMPQFLESRHEHLNGLIISLIKLIVSRTTPKNPDNILHKAITAAEVYGDSFSTSNEQVFVPLVESTTVNPYLTTSKIVSDFKEEVELTEQDHSALIELLKQDTQRDENAEQSLNDPKGKAKNPLELLISDHLGYKYLATFLRKSLATENVEFLHAVQKYSRLKDEKQKRIQAKILYDLYVSPSAVFAINIREESALSVKKALHSPEQLPSSLFAETFSDVLRMLILNRTYEAFRSSEFRSHLSLRLKFNNSAPPLSSNDPFGHPFLSNAFKQSYDERFIDFSDSSLERYQERLKTDAEKEVAYGFTSHIEQSNGPLPYSILKEKKVLSDFDNFVHTQIDSLKTMISKAARISEPLDIGHLSSTQNFLVNHYFINGSWKSFVGDTQGDRSRSGSNLPEFIHDIPTTPQNTNLSSSGTPDILTSTPDKRRRNLKTSDTNVLLPTTRDPAMRTSASTSDFSSMNKNASKRKKWWNDKKTDSKDESSEKLPKNAGTSREESEETGTSETPTKSKHVNKKDDKKNKGLFARYRKSITSDSVKEIESMSWIEFLQASSDSKASGKKTSEKVKHEKSDKKKKGHDKEKSKAKEKKEKNRETETVSDSDSDSDDVHVFVAAAQIDSDLD